MPIPKLAVLAALAALAFPASAAADVRADALVIRGGLVRSLAEGRLSQAEAERYWRATANALAVRKTLPEARRSELAGVLHDVRLQAGRYTHGRALAVFSMLETNTSYLATHPVPGTRTDVIGTDGTLYRAFSGHGLQFHPLGNVGRLNAAVTRRDTATAAQIADALVARLIRRGRTSAWEYYLPFGGGRPPWTAGMAQAAGAQALARAAKLLARDGLLEQARRVYRHAEELVIPLEAGPWTRHYSFSGMVVLNAHLQSILSLRRYAALADDAGAAELARRELRAAARLLPRFDTGSWSLYSLRGSPAPVHDHLSVIDLLGALAEQTGMPIWSRYAHRFTRYAARRGVLSTGARRGEAWLDDALDPAERVLTWAN